MYEFSPLTSDEFKAARSVAKRHFDVMAKADLDAHEHARTIGDVLRAFDAGELPDDDATQIAAQVLDLAEAAEQELEALRAALFVNKENHR
jgi:hypothetical protein